MKVASAAQRTGTVTTATKTFTGIIKMPPPTTGPSVSVVTTYTSTTDSTIISSTPSTPLTVTI
jgi:hypothetical protein